MEVYSVRDSKVGAYMAPFFVPNSSVAVRMVTDTANDPSTLLYKHPEDFQLFHIGTFNESTGEIKAINHESLGKVIDIMGLKNETK